MPTAQSRDPYSDEEPRDRTLLIATVVFAAVAGLTFFLALVHYFALPQWLGFLLLCVVWLVGFGCSLAWGRCASAGCAGSFVGAAAGLVLLWAVVLAARVLAYDSLTEEVRCTVVAAETRVVRQDPFSERRKRFVHEVEWDCAGEQVSMRRVGAFGGEGGEPVLRYSEGESRVMAYDPTGRLRFEPAASATDPWTPSVMGAVSLGTMVLLAGPRLRSGRPRPGKSGKDRRPHRRDPWGIDGDGRSDRSDRPEPWEKYGFDF
ncbi:phage holin family protein [Nocardiopsis sp. RSe5-2]|uniref:Phage holin family protein n=1 Tax=Nocardiopsis endophytica TaxID=3018445 RepID=A0ABT4U0U0_9ACTN|nr:phage holin family protein [Nocardiopsis endophytica]MDA2810569.1 phage holin family protein [Nocardiopsis endophytica]